MALFEQDAVALARMLSAREVSSEEVTRSHLERIDDVDGRVRAFTHVFRDEAIAAARRSDEERRRGQVRGVLHGMPVSIKESLDVAGAAATMGVLARRDRVARADAGVVQLLREAGAVILGRTNVSQLLMFHESDNPVFGRTSNPFGLGHTPGGSSGGEAAAVAAGMSPLGVGSDIGGSIRVPAHFTGTAGLKPTLDRWINRGSNTALVGQEAVRGQIGPMARRARDVALLHGALDPVRMSALDPRVPPLGAADPERVDLSATRVGVFVDDGMVPASIAVARAVRGAADALRGMVRSVVDFVPPRAAEIVFTYFAALSSDAGATAFAQLDGGPLHPALASMRAVARLPDRVRRMAARAAGLVREPRLDRFLDSVGKKSVTDFWRLTQELRNYRFEFLAAMDAAEIDVILCPAHSTPAFPHGLSRDFLLAGSASMLFNVLQMPAGVVPVTTVRPEEARRDRPRDQLEKRAAKVDAASAGLPVGVQVVARPWREDVALAVMAMLEDALRSSDGWPRTPTCA